MGNKDIFLLESSGEFVVAPREEVVVNLSLNKVPCIPNTLLTGFVINSIGKPIYGATVKIFTLDYIPIEHTTTDYKGKFSFYNMLMPGTYYIVAADKGYKATNGYKINIYPHYKIALKIILCKNSFK